MAHAIASQRIKRGRIILTPNENLGTTPAPRQTLKVANRPRLFESRARVCSSASKTKLVSKPRKTKYP